LEVRAIMTASWLVQMGWKDVFVLAERGAETGFPPPKILGWTERPEIAIAPAALAELLGRRAATVIDLSFSRNFRKAHIGGAWFAIRARLALALPKIPMKGTLVLTSEDGILAALAAAEAQSLVDAPVRVLAGGNEAWQRAGYAMEAGETQMADEAVDAWLKPYERAAKTREAMAEYLAWEVDLLPRIERDGTCHFRRSRLTNRAKLEETAMAKLRHIAIVVRDPEESAKFFVEAFDMKIVGHARRGVYVSDGAINVALLKVESETERLGVAHFGMWVDDLDAAEKKVLDAGG